SGSSGTTKAPSASFTRRPNWLTISPTPWVDRQRPQNRHHSAEGPGGGNWKGTASRCMPTPTPERLMATRQGRPACSCPSTCERCQILAKPKRVGCKERRGLDSAVKRDLRHVRATCDALANSGCYRCR